MSVSVSIPARTSWTKSPVDTSASRVMSQAAPQMTARARESVKPPTCAVAVAQESSSSRTFAKVRSPSLTKSRSARALPINSGTSVDAPVTSTSTRSRRSNCASATSYKPIATRCDRRVGSIPVGANGGSCSMRTDVYAPSASTSTWGRSRFTPLVCNHSRVHWERSRPLVTSSSVSKSCNSVLPHACLMKYS